MRGNLTWTSLPFALAAGFLAVRLSDRSVPPTPTLEQSIPDVTITTRWTIDHPNSTVSTEILFLKRVWQRHEQRLQFPSGSGAKAEQMPVRITRCDERRIIELNPAMRTFGSTATDEFIARPRRARAAGNDAPPAEAGANVTITIDAVDTGERRQVGPFLARHVITTRTTVAEPGANARAGTSVQDGWYIDVPPADCNDRTGQDAILLASVVRPGTPRDRVRVERRGTARRGYPIEETSRPDDGSPAARVTLIEISEAPLDEVLFTIPSGYRAALPRVHGGFDLTKPDTLVNRLASYWDEAAAWTRSILRYWSG
jgi:hypothetical protein